MPRRRVVIGGRELTLDARPDRLDFRDLPYRPPARALPPRLSRPTTRSPITCGDYAAANLVRDQGEEGACTGFGLAAVVQYLFWVRGRLSAGTLAVRAHALPPRALLRRVAGREVRRLVVPRRAEGLAQARRVHRDAVALRPRALRPAVARLGRRRGDAPAGRLLPDRPPVGRRHAGRDRRDRRDLLLGRRARRLGRAGSASVSRVRTATCPRSRSATRSTAAMRSR